MGLLLGMGSGCGGKDVTTLTGSSESGAELEPADDSRTVAVLSTPASLDAVCRFIGVSSISGAASGDRAACSATVDECRGNVQAVLGADGAASAVGLPAGDLEPLLGCPLSLAELDGCVATALERGIDEYGSAVGCDMPALPEIDPIRLLASPACLAVALRCPDLIASLAAPR